eukprot:Hpha_TRINITY_DN18933_c0_g1::TRINITY_DN18933_c0_g1_i1::g.17618::m.17618
MWVSELSAAHLASCAHVFAQQRVLYSELLQAAAESVTSMTPRQAARVVCAFVYLRAPGDPLSDVIKVFTNSAEEEWGPEACTALLWTLAKTRVAPESLVVRLADAAIPADTSSVRFATVLKSLCHIPLALPVAAALFRRLSQRVLPLLHQQPPALLAPLIVSITSHGHSSSCAPILLAVVRELRDNPAARQDPEGFMQVAFQVTIACTKTASARARTDGVARMVEASRPVVQEEAVLRETRGELRTLMKDIAEAKSPSVQRSPNAMGQLLWSLARLREERAAGLVAERMVVSAPPSVRVLWALSTSVSTSVALDVSSAVCAALVSNNMLENLTVKELCELVTGMCRLRDRNSVFLGRVSEAVVSRAGELQTNNVSEIAYGYAALRERAPALFHSLADRLMADECVASCDSNSYCDILWAYFTMEERGCHAQMAEFLRNVARFVPLWSGRQLASGVRAAAALQAATETLFRAAAARAVEPPVMIQLREKGGRDLSMLLKSFARMREKGHVIFLDEAFRTAGEIVYSSAEASAPVNILHAAQLLTVSLPPGVYSHLCDSVQRLSRILKAGDACAAAIGIAHFLKPVHEGANAALGALEKRLVDPAVLAAIPVKIFPRTLGAFVYAQVPAKLLLQTAGMFAATSGLLWKLPPRQGAAPLLACYAAQRVNSPRLFALICKRLEETAHTHPLIPSELANVAVHASQLRILMGPLGSRLSRVLEEAVKRPEIEGNLTMAEKSSLRSIFAQRAEAAVPTSQPNSDYPTTSKGVE